MHLKHLVREITPPLLWSAMKGVFGRGGKRGVESEPPADLITYRHVIVLLKRFPQLKRYGLLPTPTNARALLDFYSEILPLIYESAREAHVRNALYRLQALGGSDLHDAIERSLAISELEANSCPDRATALKGDPEYGAVWTAEVEKLEQAYGATLVSESWPGVDRGATLIHFFENHPHLLRNKSVFHLAPEPNFRDWIKTRGEALEYASSDAYGDESDETQDITEITHPDDRFDVILCHRVMEHVLDDQKGFSELYRILKPGGFVSLSVPQAPQRPTTSEWAIPDLTHHWHLRHYGADIEDRMRAAGFEVEIERWLLKQERDKLLAAHAYPMRIFHLLKQF